MEAARASINAAKARAQRAKALPEVKGSHPSRNGVAVSQQGLPADKSTPTVPTPSPPGAYSNL